MTSIRNVLIFWKMFSFFGKCSLVKMFSCGKCFLVNIFCDMFFFENIFSFLRTFYGFSQYENIQTHLYNALSSGKTSSLLSISTFRRRTSCLINKESCPFFVSFIMLLNFLPSVAYSFINLLKDVVKL